MRKKIVINGANGYLASNLIAVLLKLDYEVVALVRPNSEQNAYCRMKEALTMTYSKYSVQELDKLSVYPYSINALDFDLSLQEVREVFSDCSQYMHFAANLKFSKKTKDQIFKTNVEGLENSISIFQKYAPLSSHFYFVSTAYSCGNNTDQVDEEFYENSCISEFRNYYEQSKRYAENVLKSYIDNHGLKATVIRPSQVVGHSQNGVTNTDFGIFDFIKRMAYLSRRYPGEAIRIRAASDSTQNLIPIDLLVENMVKVLTTGAYISVIHLVAHQAVTNQQIVNCLNELLQLEIKLAPNLNKEKMKPLEKIIDAGMAFTGSYTHSDFNFSTVGLGELGAEKIQLNEDQLKSMIIDFLSKL